MLLAGTLAAIAQEQTGPQNRRPRVDPEADCNKHAGGASHGGGQAAAREKAGVTQRQKEYLEKRFDLSGETHSTFTMAGGRKNVPGGARARLQDGLTWEQLGQMITLQNFEQMFQDVFTPFQLEGLRLLLQKTRA